MRISRISLTQLIGSLVFIIVIASYVYILAPTISFWDCGEFIAAGTTFGIPHPPGNPLYVLMANAAARMFFFLPDPAMRINLLSAITGAFTALFAYLALVCIIEQATPSGFPGRLMVIYAGAACGALMAAFANTVVASSVEAEVNGPLLLPLMLCTWLAVTWAKSTSPHRDRRLIAIVCISFLGLGIHMYTMMILPSALLYVVVCDPAKRMDWRFILTALALGLVIYRLSWFLWIGPAVMLITFLGSRFGTKWKARWRFCFLLAVAAVLGFMVHLYIPVRSAMHPTIDMGHPVTLRGFMDYLDRRQYGDESMVARMFWRRGALKNQFGIEGHMGFGGFYLTQFFRIDKHDAERPLFRDGSMKGSVKLLLYLLPSAVLLYGWWFLFRRSRSTAVFLICLTLSTTLAMVLAMNFADGTRPERRDYLAWDHGGRKGPVPVVQREVRVRDYFFITGFMYCGMGIGIGGAAVLQMLFASRRRLLRLVAPAAAACVVFMPVVPMAHNLPENSRRGDTMAFAYAWNLLMSCEKNAILFTNGDNDTYPLWAIQQAYGIRKDVRVAVLSLLNTSWYIRDCRDKEPRLPLQLSDSAIDSIRPEWNPFANDTPYRLRNAGITVTLPSRKHKPYLLVQDKVILNTIETNAWNRPVYFTGLPGEGMMGLEPYLVQQGMVFRITSDTGGRGPQFDITRTEYLLDTVYRLKDFTGHTAARDETTTGISQQMHRLVLQSVQARLQQAWERNRQWRSLQAAVPGAAMPPSGNGLQLKIRDDLKMGLDRLDSCEKMFGESPESQALRKEFLRLPNG